MAEKFEKKSPVSVMTEKVEKTEKKANKALPFGKENYTLLIAGVVIILAGFFIMSLDKEEFGFGFLGITLGPIVVMSGFVVEFFAILRTPSKG